MAQRMGAARQPPLARAERKDRHGLTATAYQQEWDEAIKDGLLTRAVAGVDGADSDHVFAGAWWR